MNKIVIWAIVIVIGCLILSGMFTDLKSTISSIQTGIVMGFSVAIGNMLSKQHIEKRYRKIITSLKKKKNKGCKGKV
jgi:pantothenate kinase type III